MFKKIILPTDGSTLSARATPYALRLAREANARIILVRAYLPSGDSLPLRVEHPDLSGMERAEMDRRQAQDEFQAQVAALSKSGCLVEPHFVDGAAADVIFDTAREEQADLVVMSTHGRGSLGRLAYGSVADELIRRMPIPILLISAVCQGGWERQKPRRILVPLDGSHLATEALQPAAELVKSLGGAEIMLLAVVDPRVAVYPDAEVQELADPSRERDEANEYLQSIISEVRAVTSGPVSWRVEYGDAALAIASIARVADVDAIAIATHGRGGIARLALGSVASRTLQLASVPVLVYRPVVLRETILEHAVRIATSSASH